jgi:hypothetical protein
MNKLKGTPGPWTVTQDREFLYQCTIISESQISPVGIIYGESNAALVSAAPDLLSALMALIDRPDDFLSDFFCDFEISQARSAINKALGND